MTDFSFDERLFLLLNFDGGSILDSVMSAISGVALWIPLYLFIAWAVNRRFGWKSLIAFLACLALAMGLSGADSIAPGSPWYSYILPIVIAAIILIIGHGINLFMSAISSFVHPMRLTFVEFYKNAGFEMSQRSFDPIRKINE